MAGFEHYTYFIMATDPIHIGTGGYRIGRVDNSILRDPSTNIPKIPGSSISGVIRNYAIWNERDEEQKKKMFDCYENEAEKKKGGCGKCKICKVFGYSNNDKNLMGSVKFHDALILFFPVMTMLGPKWITTAAILEEYFQISLTETITTESVLTDFDLPATNHKINLGWIYLDAKKAADPITLHTSLNPYAGRLIIVSENLFSTLINMNLEVRTSVRIDPNTGSAKPGALFTYEAIPRTTLLAFDLIYEDFRHNEKESSPLLIEESKETVLSGMSLLNVMGIGGMNTRGFGRIKRIHEISQGCLRTEEHK